jgi:NifB/MoaA-like Fe-S oxidoreductase
LVELKKVDHDYANELLDIVEKWQEKFRKRVSRSFVYPSDEFYIVAGRKIPASSSYDGFPQTENGVGLVRTFIGEFKKQSKALPARLSKRRRMVMATATLPSGFMSREIVAKLSTIKGLDVDLEVVPNLLYGESVTVAGLLSGKCLYSALKDKDCGDMVLLPPDILNADGMFLDDGTVEKLEDQLNVPVMVFDGSWTDVFSKLKNPQRSTKTQPLLPILNPRYQPA